MKALRRLAANEPFVMILLGALLGVGTGYGAVGCRAAINAVRDLAFGSGGDITQLARGAPWWLVLFLPAAGGVLVAPLVEVWAREAKGHGVPEVMEAIARHGGRIRPRVAIAKAVASIITIGSGGSVGWEGPIVQIGAGLGSTCGQILHVARRRMRVLVACGAAAGIAATFNAPIAGVMFALEIFLGELAVVTFTPVVVAAVTATAVTYSILGRHAAFQIPTGVYKLNSMGEIPLYAALGLACAFGAVLFTRSLYWFEDLFAAIKVPLLAKPALGGLAVGAIGLCYPQTLGVGYPTIELAFRGNLTLSLLAGLFLLKLATTNLSIGSGGSGGIFAPSLVIGSLLGGLFGQIVQRGALVHAAAFPNVCSVVGMGALVAGTTHAPISAILILFEMTGDYAIILPLMIACVISSTAARGIFRESIYTLKLARRGISFRRGRDIAVLRSMGVHEVMRTDFVKLPSGMSFDDVRSAILTAKQHVFPVVDAGGLLRGIITLDAMRPLLFEEGLRGVAVASDLCRATPEVLRPDEDLHAANEMFGKAQLDELPVVDRETNQVIGILRDQEVRAAYNRAVAQLG